MIRVHVLGAGGAVPTASHGPAAYWVQVDDAGLLLDPGPGALVRLVRQPGAPDAIDGIPAVLLSHLHLDHTADLAPLLFALHSVLARDTSPLLLVGPIGVVELLARLGDVYGDWIVPRLRRLDVREVAPGETLALPNGGQATAFAARHTTARFGGACLGWTFTDTAGHRLVYSGDSGPCADLAEAARGADLLLVECSTPDDLAVPEHLSPAGIVELARAARPARIVLTHLYPLIAAQAPAAGIAARCGIPCSAARDGDVFTVGEGAST